MNKEHSLSPRQLAYTMVINTAVQRQKAVSAYFTSKQIRPLQSRIMLITWSLLAAPTVRKSLTLTTSKVLTGDKGASEPVFIVYSIRL